MTTSTSNGSRRPSTVRKGPAKSRQLHKPSGAARATINGSKSMNTRPTLRNQPTRRLTLRHVFAAAAVTIAFAVAAPTSAAPSAQAPEPFVAGKHCPPHCWPKTPSAQGRIVYLAEDSYGNNQVLRWDAGTAAPVQLTKDYGVRSPVWSPDGSVIAYLNRKLIPTTSVPWPEYIHDELVIIAPDGSQLASFGWLAGNQHRQYLTWSHSGDRICYSTLGEDWTTSGLSCLEISMSGGKYDWKTTVDSPKVVTILPDAFNAGMGILAPTESTFALDDKAIYFSADSWLTRGRLYRVPVDNNGPTGPVEAIKGDGGFINLAFAPSIGLQNGKVSLLFNSECWRYDASCQHEELMRLELVNDVSGVITRVTDMPGNQYGSYGRGAEGAYVLQTSMSKNGETYLLTASPKDTFLLMPYLAGGAPDWWVK